MISDPSTIRDWAPIRSSSPIRILTVDDHQVVRVGIATLLLTEPDMKLVGEASNAMNSTMRAPSLEKIGNKRVDKPDKEGGDESD